MGFLSVFFSQAKILHLPAKPLSCMVAKKVPKLRGLSEAVVEALKASAGQHREEHHQLLPPPVTTTTHGGHALLHPKFRTGKGPWVKMRTY